MGSHEELVEHPEQSNMFLVLFEDPRQLLSDSRENLKQLAQQVTRFSNDEFGYTALFLQEIGSLFKQQSLVAEEEVDFNSLIQHACLYPTELGAISLVLSLQLTQYLLLSPRVHQRVITAGSYASQTTQSAIIGFGYGNLAAMAISASKTTVQLVTNAVKAVKVSLAIENWVNNQVSRSQAASSGSSKVIKLKLEAVQVKTYGCQLGADKLLSDYLAAQDRPSMKTIKISHYESSTEVVFVGPHEATRPFAAYLRNQHFLFPSVHPYHAADALLHESHAQLPEGGPDYAELRRARKWDVLSDISASLDSTIISKELRHEAFYKAARFAFLELPNLDHLTGVRNGLVELVVFGNGSSNRATAVGERLAYLHLTVKCVDLPEKLLTASFWTELAEQNNSYSLITASPQTHIAIVGYSVRVPGADDPEKLWKLLKQGRDMHSEIPPHLFNLDDYHNVQYRVPNTMRTKFGNFLETPGRFDRHLFRHTEEQARQMDPQHRNALLAAYEALEMSGYVANHSESSNPLQGGVFIGGAGDDYRENASWQIKPEFIGGNYRQSVSGNISSFFDLHGPSHTYDTACSSSLVAIEAACNNISTGRCRFALAGGVSVITQPQIYVGLDRGYFLTRIGQCSTFDDAGDGYSRADANAVLHLKSLRDALADGDPIQGVISSIGTNHSGKSHSITHPHAPTQARLFLANCRSSRIAPNQVGLVEMHGTGTQAGDANEIQSVLAFARRRHRLNPLILGSVKANLGHSEAASGSVALCKILLTLKNGGVSPHIGIRTKLNTKFPPLDHVVIPLEYTPTDTSKMLACCNNFSAAGGNSSLLVSLYQHERTTSQLAKRPIVTSANTNGFSFGAATIKSLENYRSALVEFLEQQPDVNLADVGYSLSTRLVKNQKYRISVVAPSIDQLKTSLAEAKAVQIQTDANQTQFGFVFSGQGSQWVGMGRQLFDSWAVFRNVLFDCQDTLISLGFEAFIEVIFGTDPENKQPTPYHWQVGIFSVQVALYRTLEAVGITPKVVIGHSLGEYAALYVAGVVSSLGDALYLVATRASIMMEQCESNTSCMLAVATSADTVGQILTRQPEFKVCEIACINSPTSTVIAGPIDTIQQLANLIKKEKLTKCMLIPVPYAFHSAAVNPVVQPFIQRIQSIRFHEPRLPVLSNLLGKMVMPGEKVFDAEYLANHMRQPVQLSKPLCEYLVADKAHQKTRWIEVGPHITSTPMVNENVAAVGLKGIVKTPLATLRKDQDGTEIFLGSIKTLFESGYNVLWHRLYQRADVYLLPLPFYKFDYENFWIKYTDRSLSTKLIENRNKRKEKPTQKASGIKKKVKTKIISATSTRFSLLSKCTHEYSKGTEETRFEIQINDPVANEVIQSNCVQGLATLPNSLFVEAAVQATTYVWEKTKTDDVIKENDSIGFSIDGFYKSSAILFASDISQRLTVKVLGNPTMGGDVEVTFRLVENRKQSEELARCTVRVVATETAKRYFEPIQGLIGLRRKAIETSLDARLDQQFVYRLFENRSLKIAKDQQQIQKVNLSSDLNEASATLRYETTRQSEEKKTMIRPNYLETIIHTATLLANILLTDDHQTLFVESWQQLLMASEAMVRLKQGGEVNVYCTKDPEEETMDVYLFEPQSDTLIGMFRGIGFGQIQLDKLEKKHKSTVPQALVTRLASKMADVAPPVTAPAVSFTKPVVQSVSKVDTTPSSQVESQHPKIEIQQETLEVTPPSSSPTQTASTEAAKQLLGKMVKTIVEELGIEEGELTKDAQLADYGLDSLMALMIIGSFTDSNQGVEIPSSLFMDYPTLTSLERFFTQTMGSKISTSHGSQGEEGIYSASSTSSSSSPALLFTRNSSSTSVENFFNSTPSQDSGFTLYTPSEVEIEKKTNTEMVTCTQSSSVLK